MPITLNFPTEPLTAASTPETTRWATCEAFRQLRQQIRRYCLGELLGQSVLFAGHRGSGKTLLAHLAIEQTQWESDTESRAPDLQKPSRPFLVSIHGPDLLRHQHAFGNPTGSDGLVRDALRQIAKALHLALAKEVGLQYAALAANTNDPRLTEIAHELMAQLDRAPHAADLRQFYAALDVLEDDTRGNGLFPVRGTANRRLAGRATPSQAWSELFALTTAIDAVQHIAHDVEAENERDRGAPRARTARVEAAEQHIDSFTKALRLRQVVASISPLLTLIVAMVVGYQAFAGLQDAFAASILALVTGALTFFFLRYATGPSQERTLHPTTDIPDLDRLLPYLVERVQRQSLAPIFVVDELDKVDSVDNKLECLIRGAKYFIADRAFFVFLTDRDYYEAIQRRIDESAGHTIESTFFNERLLIAFTPSDLAPFIRDHAIDPSSYPADDRVLLPFMLHLHSKLHVGDLQRFLLTNEKKLPPNHLSPSSKRAYALAVFFQIAIEAVLSDERVERRLHLTPQILQPILDTLYYPVWDWFSDSRQTNMLSLEKNHLADYLVRRVAPAARLRSNYQVKTPDLAFLTDDVLLPLIALLKGDPMVAYDQYFRSLPKERREVSLSMVQAFLRDGAVPLLDPSGPDNCQWRFNHYGEPLTDGARDFVRREVLFGSNFGSKARIVRMAADLATAGGASDLLAFCDETLRRPTTLFTPEGALADIATAWNGAGPSPTLDQSIALVEEWFVFLVDDFPGQSAPGYVFRLALAFTILARAAGRTGPVSALVVPPDPPFPWRSGLCNDLHRAAFDRWLPSLPRLDGISELLLRRALMRHDLDACLINLLELRSHL